MSQGQSIKRERHGSSSGNIDGATAVDGSLGVRGEEQQMAGMGGVAETRAVGGVAAGSLHGDHGDHGSQFSQRMPFDAMDAGHASTSTSPYASGYMPETAAVPVPVPGGLSGMTLKFSPRPRLGAMDAAAEDQLDEPRWSVHVTSPGGADAEFFAMDERDSDSDF